MSIQMLPFILRYCSWILFISRGLLPPANHSFLRSPLQLISISIKLCSLSFPNSAIPTCSSILHRTNRAPFGNVVLPEGSVNRSSPLINYPCLRCLPEAGEEGGGGRPRRVVLSTVTGEDPNLEIAGLLRRLGMFAGRMGGGEFSPARGVRQVGRKYKTYYTLICVRGHRRNIPVSSKLK